MKLLNILFWAKQTGNFMTHRSGLTEVHVEELKKLEPGDRLILFKNDRTKETDSYFSLKVVKDKEKF